MKDANVPLKLLPMCRKIWLQEKLIFIHITYTSSNQRCMGTAVSSGAVVFPFLLFANGFCDTKYILAHGKLF